MTTYSQRAPFYNAISTVHGDFDSSRGIRLLRGRMMPAPEMLMEQDATTRVPLDNYPAEPKRKRILLKWSLLATALLFGYFMWQCGSAMSAGTRLSDDVVRRFHSQLDSGAYDDIVRGSDEAFQESGSREELLRFLAGVHSKLGASRGFTRANIFVNASTNGTFIKVYVPEHI